MYEYSVRANVMKLPKNDPLTGPTAVFNTDAWHFQSERVAERMI